MCELIDDMKNIAVGYLKEISGAVIYHLCNPLEIHLTNETAEYLIRVERVAWVDGILQCDIHGLFSERHSDTQIHDEYCVSLNLSHDNHIPIGTDVYEQKLPFDWAKIRALIDHTNGRMTRAIDIVCLSLQWTDVHVLKCVNYPLVFCYKDPNTDRYTVHVQVDKHSYQPDGQLSLKITGYIIKDFPDLYEEHYDLVLG